MKIEMKICLITAVTLLLAGALLFVIIMSLLEWDFGKLSTAKYQTNTYSFTEDIKDISIITDTADVELLPADDSVTRVVCFEKKNMTHTVNVNDGTLNIQHTDNRKWYEYIEITAFSSPKVTVYLPKEKYSSLLINLSTGDVEIPKNFLFGDIEISGTTGDVECSSSAENLLKISLNTGDIDLNNLSANDLSLSLTTGDISIKSLSADKVNLKISTGDTELKDINCRDFYSSGTTGDITLKNVTAEEKLTLKRSTGDTKFYALSAGEISITSSTGDVKGSIKSQMIFVAKSDTGKTVVPASVSGGMCEIKTTTGDIIINAE